jgi:1-pyrroline-4-hydroxy-2-carboxylate deaminase
MPSVEWKGIYPALLTPFKSDDTIDFDMFSLNVNAQLDAGIDGVIIGGSLGEASTLKREEIFALLRFAKKSFKRPIPRIATIAEQSTEAAV